MPEDARQLLPDPFLRLRVGDIALPAPVFAAPLETVARAAARMDFHCCHSFNVRSSLPFLV